MSKTTKKKATAKSTAPVTTDTSPKSVSAAEPATAPAQKPKKSAKKGTAASVPAGTGTLADIAAGYLSQMELEGKSEGTISSYRAELKTAMKEIGEETLVSDLTPQRLERFNNCARVTKLRSGKPKAMPSVAKTRRVIRLALAWAQERGLIATSPIPESATTN